MHLAEKLNCTCVYKPLALQRSIFYVCLQKLTYLQICAYTLYAYENILNKIEDNEKLKASTDIEVTC